MSVTVAHVPTDRARRLRAARASLAKARWPPVAVRALAVVVLAAVPASVLERAWSGPSGNTVGATQQAGPAGVAAAFGYPRRCLNIAISAGDPEYASARVDRRRGCANYHGYVNASFHRIDGAWRLILDEGQLFVPNGLLTPAAATSAPAAAAGYPLPCLSVEITLHDARFARAAFDRRLACVRGLSDRARRRASRPAWSAAR